MKRVNTPGCPICGNAASTPIRIAENINESTEDKPAIFELQGWVGCTECTCFYNSKTFLDREIRKYYDGEYRAKDYPTLHDRAVVLSRADRQLNMMEKFEFPTPKSVLDVGCARGTLLDELRLKHGCKVTGTEYCSVDRKLAMELYDIELRVDLDEFEGEKFDLIVLSHLLEHIPVPVMFLTKLRRLAEPECRLFIEVPGGAARGAWADFHLVVYSPDTIKKVLVDAGWEVLGGSVSEDRTLMWCAGRNPPED